jgi:deazaflavin-dependent oxidoreductase (nitroreductase family)
MESTELARLRRVAGKQTTRLTHYGRKTGNPHEVTIWFVLDGDRLYIGTANVKRQWVRNVQKTPTIKLSIGGKTFEGSARFLTDRAEHERAMAAIRRKYWDVSTYHWAWARPHRDGTDKRQYRSFGCMRGVSAFISQPEVGLYA